MKLTGIIGRTELLSHRDQARTRTAKHSRVFVSWWALIKPPMNGRVKRELTLSSTELGGGGCLDVVYVGGTKSGLEVSICLISPRLAVCPERHVHGGGDGGEAFADASTEFDVTLE